MSTKLLNKIAVWNGEKGRNLVVYPTLCPCGCDKGRVPKGTSGYLSVSGPDGFGVTIYLTKKQVTGLTASVAASRVGCAATAAVSLLWCSNSVICRYKAR